MTKPPTSDEGYRWQDRDFDGLPPAEPDNRFGRLQFDEDARLGPHGWRHHLRLTALATLALAACLILVALLFGAPCDRASNFAPASGRYCK